uniref:Globin domain-containing protein n=1 Tax=Clastoptera arizonana TaxID=38151 RepID=A0A1B6DUK0_9HEMI
MRVKVVLLICLEIILCLFLGLIEVGTSNTEYQEQITEKDINLTRQCWVEVEKDYEGTGTLLFTELFTSFPDYIKIFSKLKSPGEDDIFKSPRFKKHMTTALLPSIGEMLNNLDKEEALKKQLLEIGRTHKRRNITKDNFENIKNVIIKTLAIRFGDKFTPEMDTAWHKILTAGFSIIYTTLE